MNESRSILVIDDNPADLKLVTALLEKQGYAVFSCSDAPAGIEMAMSIHPALIVLDVMMPIINGYNICRLIKDQSEYAQIPILLLTSRTTDEDQRIGFEAGADAYIIKPFETRSLLDTVKKLLDQSLC